jgi:tRNA(Ile)-lysidine synthase TilS/MesJ
VLPETFPGIRFDADGVCQYCRSRAGAGEEGLRERYREKFERLAEEVRGTEDHDVLLAFSGGKDSTYTLKILRERYGLRVLAFTFDNGFISPRARENIGAVTKAMNVDHMMFSPGFETLSRAFRKSAEDNLYSLKEIQRASSICNTCMHMVKGTLLRTAIEGAIPMIAFGWSPGQVPVQSAVTQLQPTLLRQMQGAALRRLQPAMGDEAGRFFPGERHFKILEAREGSSGEAGICHVHPLAFEDYREEEILREIKELGWRNPRDTDANSSNCLLNGLANRVHVEKHGFHPYAFEVAGLVRCGAMGREKGLARLEAPVDEGIVDWVANQLGIGK